MSYILMIAGAALIFLGIKMNISKYSINELADQKIDKSFKTGCRGYFKFMLIIGGVALIIIGFILEL